LGKGEKYGAREGEERGGIKGAPSHLAPTHKILDLHQDKRKG